MRSSTISRRDFLGALGTTVATLGPGALLRAQPPGDNIQLGMMLQGGSADELQQKAKTIAATGFERVQLTFFFEPAAAEIQALAPALKSLNLKTATFGTYFNLLRPDDTGFMGASLATMKLVASGVDAPSSARPGSRNETRSFSLLISRTTTSISCPHAGLFGCNQFVTWSGSYAPKFDGNEDLAGEYQAIIAYTVYSPGAQGRRLH